MRRSGIVTWFVLLSVGSLALSACVQPGLEDPLDETAVVAERRADALSLVPADAAAAVVLRDLSAFEADLRQAAEIIQHPMPERFLRDLVRDRLGGAAGIREDGAMMLVYPDAASLIDDAEPEVLVFVAVDDYRAFVGAGLTEAVDAGVREVRVMDERWYARPVEGFAVLGRDPERLTQFRPALATDGSLRDELAYLGATVAERADVMAVVNMTAFAPVLRPLVGEDADHLAQSLDCDWIDPADLHALVALYQNGADVLLRDAETIVVGADLGAQGVELTTSLNLRPDSELGRMLAVGGAAAALFEDLPAGPLRSAAAIDFGGIDVEAVADWVVAAVPEGGPLYELMAASFDMVTQTDGVATASFRSDDPTAWSGSSVSVFRGAGAQSLPSLVAGYVDRINGVAVSLPPIATEDEATVTAEASWAVTWDAEPLTVGELQVERFVMEPHVPDAYLELAETSLPATGWLPRTEIGLVAARGDTGVLAMGDDYSLIERVLDGSADGSRLSDNAELAHLRAQALQPGPFFELYVDVGPMFHVWGSASGDSWAPMAVLGHVSSHEVAAQMVLPIESIRSWWQ